MISKWLPCSQEESTILGGTFFRSNNGPGNIYDLKHVANLRLTWASLQCEFNQFLYTNNSRILLR